jgi:hypothetical protein
LDAHKLARPETYKKRLELFAKAIKFRSSDALTQAKSRLAVTRAKQLRVLQTLLEDYRRQIEELFAEHPDHDLFGSLAGAGVCWSNWGRIVIGSNPLRSCNATAGLLRSVISPAPSTRSDFVASAT